MKNTEECYKVCRENISEAGLWVVKSEYCVVRALKSPRWSKTSQRDESSRPGVYILADGAKEKIYIGQTDTLQKRIRTHKNNKFDWWEEMLWITPDGGYRFGTDRRRYVESKLISQARKQEIKLKNDQFPEPPQLDPDEQKDLDEKVLNPILQIFIPLMMGFNFVLPSPQRDTEPGCIEFEIIPQQEGIKAFAKIVGGKWIVQKDSQARKDWKGGARTKEIIKGAYYNLYQSLKKQDILREDEKFCVFTEDHEFDSPSAAASVIYGRQAAGPRNWNVRGEDKTYREWEKENP